MSEHVCSFYCQHGEHAYVCLIPVDYAAAEVRRDAQIWVTHMGWPDEVVRVQRAREMESQQGLVSGMIEVDPRTGTAHEVDGDDYRGLLYHPWLVFLRPTATAPSDVGEEE